MKRKQKLLLFFYILFISSYCLSQTSHLPNISIKSNSGDYINIREYSKDKTIILNFWATWCVPCIEELNNINDIYTEWEKDNIILLAISIDDSRTISRVLPLANGNNWNYKILFDKNQELKRAFNITDIPYQIAIHNGEIVYNHIGYKNGDEKILYKKIKEFIVHK